MGIENLALAVLMAVAAGLVGAFAVMRRMALAADALSHVALPGIGIALAAHANPLFGGVMFLLMGAALIWSLEGRSRLGTEAMIGVLFSVALAGGTLMTSGEELIEALFGGAGALGPREAVFAAVASAAVIAFMIARRRQLVVMLVSPDVARTAGIPTRGLELAYLLLFALTVGLGLRYLGVLLMGALIIIPAATAKRLATNLNGMLTIAAGLAVAATLAGTMLAARVQRPAGPLIVLVAAVLFVISFLRR